MSIMKSIFIASTLAATALATPMAYAGNPTAEEVANIKSKANITVGLNGLVCDFCSIALNKTFKKHDAVAATYVDLDSKSMSVVLKDGASLNDEKITKLVKKAGYNVAGIERKAG